MSANREFSHITLSSTPFKNRMDQQAKKNDSDVEKDRNIAIKCAERFNYNTNLLRKVTLSDRFELAALGFEMKSKPSSYLDKNQESEEFDYIYRKEKKQDYNASPLPAGMSPTNPLPAGRGFLSPAIQATNSAFPFAGSPKSTPQKYSNSPAPRQPIRSLFDDIPANIA
ncbi:hypothetical protein GCK72_005737 [Caenorhabditis remanei]|nr:hypothetical protein GCK72_005737 [Caenorhabditis remanei]KAF1765784.1 hypothetical protein GCK72_005737 [Caenorhabditis remanei]